MLSFQSICSSQVCFTSVDTDMRTTGRATSFPQMRRATTTVLTVFRSTVSWRTSSGDANRAYCSSSSTPAENGACFSTFILIAAFEPIAGSSGPCLARSVNTTIIPASSSLFRNFSLCFFALKKSSILLVGGFDGSFCDWVFFPPVTEFLPTPHRTSSDEFHCSRRTETAAAV